MSLKSKLEAVIYAAEEPVTLTQLATLFGAEALEWKAEQEAARRIKLPAESAADPSQSAIARGIGISRPANRRRPTSSVEPDSPAEAGRVWSDRSVSRQRIGT